MAETKTTKTCKNCKHYEEWQHFISGYGTSIIHKCKGRMNEGMMPFMNEPRTISDVEKLCEIFKEV